MLVRTAKDSATPFVFPKHEMCGEFFDAVWFFVAGGITFATLLGQSLFLSVIVLAKAEEVLSWFNMESRLR